MGCFGSTSPSKTVLFVLTADLTSSTASSIFFLIEVRISV